MSPVSHNLLHEGEEQEGEDDVQGDQDRPV